MDNFNFKNMQLAYSAVYDQDLCESMEELGLIGDDYLDEARDGYGPDEKFKKPDDNIEKPGTTVPAPKKGGYGRIFRGTPYGIGAHSSRTQSAVTRATGGVGIEPRAVKMPVDSPSKTRRVIETPKRESKPKMVKKDGRWVKEALEYYNVILSHLLDEGYAETPEAAESIMMNMSETWVESILENLD